jgi:Anti-sigma-K factor rskA
MDHDEVLEQLELAAVEPGGLDRLMAGDTAMAAAVVGHLAGCEPCSEELRRLSRAAPLLRDLVRTTPPADLRDRTLAFVRERGRPRGEAADRPQVGPDQPTPATSGKTRSRIPAWAAAIAAAVIVAVGVVGFQVGRTEAERNGTAVGALETVTRTALDISSEPDARRVTLTSSGGTLTSGTLLFSPSTTRLVVVATDLGQPPSGKEYRCWVEIDGARHDVGRMFFADELAFWVGDTPEVSDLPDGTLFGVSLTDVGGPSLSADPVIVGEL